MLPTEVIVFHYCLRIPYYCVNLWYSHRGERPPSMRPQRAPRARALGATTPGRPAAVGTRPTRRCNVGDGRWRAFCHGRGTVQPHREAATPIQAERLHQDHVSDLARCAALMRPLAQWRAPHPCRHRAYQGHFGGEVHGYRARSGPPGTYLANVQVHLTAGKVLKLHECSIIGQLRSKRAHLWHRAYDPSVLARQPHESAGSLPFRYGHVNAFPERCPQQRR